MTRRKWQRILETKTFPNVRQPDEKTKGTWQAFFQNTHPITLELGCGTGVYTLSLAEQFPERNYIGVDWNAARIWVGATTAMSEQRENVAFLRAKINQLDMYMEDACVQDIWITFPDPYPRKKHEKHRLTAPGFLTMYQKILVPGGRMHLKTDNKELFDYSLASIRSCNGRILELIEDVHGQATVPPLLLIQTTFERRHIADGRQIYYVQWTFA